MTRILTEPIRGPVAWSGSELASDERWIRRLSSSQLDELARALSAVNARAIPTTSIARDDFELPLLARELAAVAEELEGGTGLTLLRGIPVERYSEADAARILWGLGTHLGTAIPQNAAGDLVGHVRDAGKTLADPKARGYETHERQSLHVDRCDVVALMCLRKAHSGGISDVASTVRVHNEMLATCPWYLSALYRPFAIDMRGEEQPGEPPVYYRPVFSWYEGHFAAGANATYIRSGQAKIGAPLSAVEEEALDAFYALAEKHKLAMDLEPGDVQLLNSYVTLHDRTAYVDDPDPAKKRHMLRLWLAVPNRRPLAPEFGTYHFRAQTSSFVPAGSSKKIAG
ncbi:MAG: TauD/TfdA family dioxygenase [Candidatus Eremiobacteraeota bacterium]|nr:TauD/TfdA family dioxygenase [Candidatus Eremiobacteraeota bacterium]